MVVFLGPVHCRKHWSSQFHQVLEQSNIIIQHLLSNKCPWFTAWPFHFYISVSRLGKQLHPLSASYSWVTDILYSSVYFAVLEAILLSSWITGNQTSAIRKIRWHIIYVLQELKEKGDQYISCVSWHYHSIWVFIQIRQCVAAVFRPMLFFTSQESFSVTPVSTLAPNLHILWNEEFYGGLQMMHTYCSMQKLQPSNMSNAAIYIYAEFLLDNFKLNKVTIHIL
jgi:hypothetical protein